MHKKILNQLIESIQHIYIWLLMAFRHEPIRRTITRVFCSVFFLVLFGVSLSIAQASNTALANAQKLKVTNTKHEFELNVGEQSIILCLETHTPGWRLGAALTGDTDSRKLRRRTVTKFPLYKTEEADLDNSSVTSDDNLLPEGTVTLTIDDINGNYALYLQSDAACDVSATFTTESAKEPTIRSIHSDSEAPSEPVAITTNQPYDADSAYFIETDTFHLYTSKLESLSPLGSTVYACTTPTDGIQFNRAETLLSVKIPLSGKQDEIATAAAVLTAEPLLDWNEPFAVSTAMTLDASSNDFHLLSDGVYLYEPTTYRPRLAEDSEKDHIYLSAAAWMLGPCTDIRSGALFDTLGKSMVYTYIDRINKDGFIPTQPSSTWLSQNHGINAGFYDTRFNFDTIRRLLYADKSWNDTSIRTAVHKMLNFYIDFANSTAYTVNGMPFVPDYGQTPPDTKVSQANGPSCSLNHYLTEGTFLIRVGRLYNNENYIVRGRAILDVIEKSYKRWIRPTGDLWYAIQRDGTMEKNDYIEVTYADLTSTLALLSKMGITDQYPGIRALYDSKQDWLRRAGYPDVIAAYSLDTMSDPSDDIIESILISQSAVMLPSDMLFPLLSSEMRDILLNFTPNNKYYLNEDTSVSPDDAGITTDSAINEASSAPIETANLATVPVVGVVCPFFALTS